MQFAFSEFAPDAGELAPGVLMQAQGVQPQQIGYGPAPSLQTPASATALPGACRGMVSLTQRDGTNVVFAFTATAAYELSATYALDGTPIGTGFNCTSGDDWSLTGFGNKLMATNTTDGLQAYDIESPAGFTAIADAGNPRDIFRCANTLVGLDCLDANSNRDNRLVRSSAIGDQTEWKKKGADKQPLEDGGALIGGIDLKNNAALLFQADAIRVMQFGSGPAGTFSLLKAFDKRGSVGRRSLIGIDGVAYWLSTDGFKMFSQANGLAHIGAGKIDKWFFDRVDQSNLAKVQVGLDPLNKLVVWRYPSLQITSETVFDDCLGYSWQFNKWFYWQEQTTYLSQIATPGYTLDGMNDFGPLDSNDIPLDDRFWQGGQPVFAALDENLKYATFSGANYAAVLESGFSNSPVSGLIGWATPIDNAASGTLQLGVKDSLDDAATWKTGAAKVSAGRVPLRGRGMNIAFRRNIDAGDDWSYANGVNHVVAATGGRK